MTTSPSRLSNFTLPISIMYRLTGSLWLSLSTLAETSELGFRILSSSTSSSSSFSLSWLTSMPSLSNILTTRLNSSSSIMCSLIESSRYSREMLCLTLQYSLSRLISSCRAGENSSLSSKLPLSSELWFSLLNLSRFDKISFFGAITQYTPD